MNKFTKKLHTNFKKLINTKSTIILLVVFLVVFLVYINKIETFTETIDPSVPNTYSGQCLFCLGLEDNKKTNQWKSDEAKN